MDLLTLKQPPQKTESEPKKSKAGFTMIEILMVVLIIGMLAAMAVPAFHKVKENALKTEGYSLADGIRREIMGFYAHTGRFPKNNKELGLPNPEKIRGKKVSSIEIKNGEILVQFTGGIEPLHMYPIIEEEDPTGSIYWDTDPEANKVYRKKSRHEHTK